MPNFFFHFLNKKHLGNRQQWNKNPKKKDKCLRDTFHQIAISQWQQQHTRERNRNNYQRTHNRSRPSPSSCTHNPPHSSLRKNTINQFARLKKKKNDVFLLFFQLLFRIFSKAHRFFCHGENFVLYFQVRVLIGRVFSESNRASSPHNNPNEKRKVKKRALLTLGDSNERERFSLSSIATH